MSPGYVATRASSLGRRAPRVPAVLFVGSVALYVAVALWTGETRMLDTDGTIGLLQRMVALGVVALGQTFVIIGGSIDLSVANMISVAAVLASFIMQGHVDMVLPAVAMRAGRLRNRRRSQRPHHYPA